MIRSANLALAAIVGSVLLGAGATRAVAQQDMSGQIVASLEYRNVDVREALNALFKNVHVTYTIDPKVQGVVTVSLKNVTFEAALQNILRQVDASYRLAGGVYQIVTREEEPAPLRSGDSPGRIPALTPSTHRVRIRSADPEYLARMIGTPGGSNRFSGSFPELSTFMNVETARKLGFTLFGNGSSNFGGGPNFAGSSGMGSGVFGSPVTYTAG